MQRGVKGTSDLLSHLSAVKFSIAPGNWHTTGSSLCNATADKFAVIINKINKTLPSYSYEMVYHTNTWIRLAKESYVFKNLNFGLWGEPKSKVWPVDVNKTCVRGQWPPPIVQGCLELFVPHPPSLYYNIIFKEFSEKRMWVRNAFMNHCNWLWSAILM